MENEEFVDEREFYSRNIFYGRTNTLNFLSQSCHEFCLTCSELGSSNNNQKCISCREEYSYYYPKNFTSNCVPINQFYDIDLQRLIECTEENSYYIIDDNNKKICFKNDNCPKEYPYLNEETKECLKNVPNISSDTEISYSGLEIIPSLINNCSHDGHILSNWTAFFVDNEEAYNYMLEILQKFEPDEEKSIYLTTENNLAFEITTTQKEKSELNGKLIRDNLTMIDIEKCENVLREIYDFNENVSLIFLKSENLNSIPSERNVQYEIYESINKTKLNLSLCEGTDIDLYFPVELNSQTQQLFEDLNKQGYDLFNIKDKFYQDICTPYKSENGTDILLSDRINDLYYKNNNLTTCQENCEYSDYTSETKLLKCKCNVNTEPIDYKNQKKFTPKKIYESFYDVLKYSNYKVLTCYKLIFEKDPVSSNIGSILVIIFFGIYFFFLIFLIFKGITPLKIDIIKTIDNPKQKAANIISNKNILINNQSINMNNNKKTKKLSIVFPPLKKSKSINQNKKNAKKNSSKSNRKSSYQIKNLSYIDNKIFIIDNSENGKFKGNNPKLIQDKNDKGEQKQFDDFEINELEYLDAKIIDTRSFMSIYWSILKREHKIIFTFFIRNDYNLYYIKFMRFIFLV